MPDGSAERSQSVLAGSVIPESVGTAMGIALYAMFIAIIIPPSRESLPVRLTVVIAVVISCGLCSASEAGERLVHDHCGRCGGGRHVRPEAGENRGGGE